MKLEYVNNWESDEFYVGKKRVKSLEEVCIEGVVYEVTGREVQVPYNDMGNTYYADSMHYFVKETVFGKVMEFDLGKIMRNPGVVVYAKKWKF